MVNFFSRSRTAALPQLSIEDLEEFLLVISKAAILINNESRQIVAVNPKVMEISAYTRAELKSMQIEQLFNECIDAYLVARQSQREPTLPRLILLTRNGHHIPVSLHAQPLANNRPWVLLTFESVDLRKRKKIGESLLSNLLNEQLLALAVALSIADPDAALKRVLEIGETLLPESTLGAYIGQSQKPSARLVSARGPDADVLPDEVSAQDLNHLFKASLWRQGERAILTLLHQRVRTAKFAYLASSPISEPSETRAWLGFLVAGGRNTPHESTAQILNILAAFTGTIIRNTILLTHLRRSITDCQARLNTWELAKDHIRDGVIVISPSMQVVSVNPSAEYIFGYAAREIQGVAIENVLIGNKHLIPAIQNALEGTTIPNIGNATLHRRDGTIFPAELSITPLHNGDQLSGAIIIVRDISKDEQIRIHTQQLEQRALLGEVTAVFAHEVRNPINNISMGLQLLDRRFDNDHPEKERILNMQDDCQRLTALMDSVLVFSRTGNYAFVPTDAHQLLQRILKRWHPRMAHVGVEYHLQASKDLPEISGDARSLEQVFTNIISNAIQAMQENGGLLSIKLSTKNNPGGKTIVQIDFSDTGPGIPEAHIEKIFDPFYTTNPQGTGLGLAITKQIITAHRGTITVTSFPGGTIFHVQLPVATPTTETPAL